MAIDLKQALVSEIVDGLWEDLLHPPERISVGWERFDNALLGGPQINSFVLLGGPPKSGKSLLAQTWAEHWATGGRRAYVFDFEMGKRRWFERLMQRHGQSPDRQVCLNDLTQWCHEKQLHYMHAPTINTAAFAGFCASLFETETAPVLVVVDSLQCLANLSGGGDRREQIDQWLRCFEACRARYPMIILVTSEVSRVGSGKEWSRETMVYKESGDAEYKADLALFLLPIAVDHSLLYSKYARDDTPGDIAVYKTVRPYYDLKELPPDVGEIQNTIEYEALLQRLPPAAVTVGGIKNATGLSNAKVVSLIKWAEEHQRLTPIYGTAGKVETWLVQTGA